MLPPNLHPVGTADGAGYRRFKFLAPASDGTSMRRSIAFDLVTIPRWTIQREALPPSCPDCGSVVVRVLAERRRVCFCVCRVVADEFVPRRERR